MKPFTFNKDEAEKSQKKVNALEDAINTRVRTGVRAGADDGGSRCKPWLCAQPLYGVVLLD